MKTFVLHAGESYYITQGNMECYCEFKYKVDDKFYFDNSGHSVIVEEQFLLEQVEL